MLRATVGQGIELDKNNHCTANKPLHIHSYREHGLNFTSAPASSRYVVHTRKQQIVALISL